MNTFDQIKKELKVKRGKRSDPKIQSFWTTTNKMPNTRCGCFGPLAKRGQRTYVLRTDGEIPTHILRCLAASFLNKAYITYVKTTVPVNPVFEQSHWKDPFVLIHFPVLQMPTVSVHSSRSWAHFEPLKPLETWIKRQMIDSTHNQYSLRCLCYVTNEIDLWDESMSHTR